MLSLLLAYTAEKTFEGDSAHSVTTAGWVHVEVSQCTFDTTVRQSEARHGREVSLHNVLHVRHSLSGRLRDRQSRRVFLGQWLQYEDV